MNFAEVSLAEQGGKIVAEATGLRIVLPDSLAARARAKMTGAGTKATLGIRPENIHVAGAADSADHCFDANIEVVEQLGSEILLDTRVGSALMVASIDPTMKVRAHDKLRLALNPERLHLFDAQTEMAY
jgi:multiple sugar transport system ATP-binding protein